MRVLRAFGLPIEDWAVIGWGAALAGRRYEQIVAVVPDNATEYHRVFLRYLATKLGPGGVVEEI